MLQHHSALVGLRAEVLFLVTPSGASYPSPSHFSVVADDDDDDDDDVDDNDDDYDDDNDDHLHTHSHW